MFMARLLTVGLLLLLLPCLCLATGFYAQNVTADIRVPCINNETYCSPSAVCNITIFLPNNSLLVDNEPMTNQGNFFNYSLTNTGVLGLYHQQIVCSDGGVNGYSLSEFRITKEGLNNELNGLNVVGVIVAVIFAIILFIVVGFLVHKEHPLLGVPLIIAGFVMIILLVNLSRIGLNPNMEVSDAMVQMGNLYQLVVQFVIVIIVYVIGYILVSVVRFIMDDLKKKKLEKQGLL